MAVEYAVVGVLIGVAVRTLIPWLQKQNPAESWEQKYTLSAILSVIVGVITVAQEAIATLPPGADFIAGLMAGIIYNSGLNETVKRA